jgi:hypothetical protein
MGGVGAADVFIGTPGHARICHLWQGGDGGLIISIAPESPVGSRVGMAVAIGAPVVAWPAR